jgi:micrococcal nuclease
MMVRMRLPWLVFMWLVVLLCAATAEPPSSELKVVRVVDGTTVILQINGRSMRARLFGVDAPISVYPRNQVRRLSYGSTEFLRGLVEGKAVSYADVTHLLPSRYKYGGPLVYLHRESDRLFVNREIIAKGFGHAWVDYPYEFRDDFRAAERAARDKKLGQWGPDPEPAAATADTTVYVTKTGDLYHRSGCRALAKNATAIPLGQAARRYSACRTCTPPKLP